MRASEIATTGVKHFAVRNNIAQTVSSFLAGIVACPGSPLVVLGISLRSVNFIASILGQDHLEIYKPNSSC